MIGTAFVLIQCRLIFMSHYHPDPVLLADFQHRELIIFTVNDAVGFPNLEERRRVAGRGRLHGADEPPW